MKSQMNKLIGVISTIASILFFWNFALAENSEIVYPVKRHLTGHVMSITPPFGKGKDGVIMVDEKIYRVTPQTVMVDQDDNKRTLDYFKPGNQVYMIIDIYERYNEALFISTKGY